MKKVWDEYVNMQLIFKFICHLCCFLVFSYYLCNPKIKNIKDNEQNKSTLRNL
jgi:hypothetical protein